MPTGSLARRPHVWGQRHAWDTYDLPSFFECENGRPERPAPRRLLLSLSRCDCGVCRTRPFLTGMRQLPPNDPRATRPSSTRHSCGASGVRGRATGGSSHRDGDGRIRLRELKSRLGFWLRSWPRVGTDGEQRVQHVFGRSRRNNGGSIMKSGRSLRQGCLERIAAQ
jgi:hypothetical protein